MGTYLVTGGAGFIGSHFCRLSLKEKWCDRLINVDSLTYAGNLNNLSSMSGDKRYEFIQQDILEAAPLLKIVEKVKPDYIIHFAAESHVDRSIEDPDTFLKTNILGTYHLLEAINGSKADWAKRVKFIFISTDEVYGSLGHDGQFFETTPFAPRSPYSVSKAAADMLTQAYRHTYNSNVITLRCSNNYGPFQYPEKLISQTILFAHLNRSIPVYAEGKNVRDWIYVEDFVRGVHAALENGKIGEAYNFGGKGEHQNIEVVKLILKLMDKPESLIKFVEDRKGHDFRYSMNFDKAEKELNWKPTVSFEAGIKKTIEWYLENKDWWEALPLASAG